MAVNMDAFKKDIDELIGEFAQDESTTFADMKRVWLSKKFTYIYQASPSTNLAFFMQSLYAHSIGYMVGTASLSHRLGGLYCLYCLYEVQPFKPPFKVYLSLGQLKRLKILVIEAKANHITTVPAMVKRMMERNMFLFGAVDSLESSAAEMVNQLHQVQHARIQVAYEKLFGSTALENNIHMNLGMEVDLHTLKKMSSEYAEAKSVAINEASESDVEDIKHIAEDKELIGDVVEKKCDEWNAQKQIFYQQTVLEEDGVSDRELERILLGNYPHDGESSEE